MKAKNPILAPSGFPWRSAFVGVVVLAAGMGIGLGLIGANTLGGTFVVSAIIAAGAFAAALG